MGEGNHRRGGQPHRKNNYNSRNSRPNQHYQHPQEDEMDQYNDETFGMDIEEMSKL
jgi:hypothetical protein